MAVFQVSTPLDMRNLPDQDENAAISRTGNADGFEVRWANLTVIAKGYGFTFNANRDNTGGVFTEVQMIQNGATLFHLTGANAPDSDVFDRGLTLGNQRLYGMGAEAAYWLREDDTVIGSAGNDILSGFGGNDQINGGDGRDTAVYFGNRSQFNVERAGDGSVWVTDMTGAQGTDVLVNVERLLFTDAELALDTAGAAGQAYRLYQAAFNRMPDSTGLAYQTRTLDAGWSLKSVAQNFLDSPEFQATYGHLDDRSFVIKLYENVLHRGPDEDGLAYHVNDLANGADRAQLLANFSESPENQDNLLPAIQSGMLLPL